MPKTIITQNSDNRQLQLIPDDKPLPERIADGGSDWQAFPLSCHDVAGQRYYSVRDWIVGVAQTPDPAGFWDNLKKRLEKADIQLSPSWRQLPYTAANGKTYQMDHAIDITLYQITQRMDANTGIRNRILAHLAKAGAIVDAQYIADQKQKALDTAKNAYQVNGRNANWSAVRVEGKAALDARNAVARDTHETHEPKYWELAAAQNQGLFNMAKDEIVRYLGLLPKQADQYRDHLGEFALQALNLADRTIALRMKSLKRTLTSHEQREVVVAVVNTIGPTMQQLAVLANQDFISGADLDASGQLLLSRNVRLLRG